MRRYCTRTHLEEVVCDNHGDETIRFDTNLPTEAADALPVEYLSISYRPKVGDGSYWHWLTRIRPSPHDR